MVRQMEQPNYPTLRLIRRSRLVIRLVSPSSGEISIAPGTDPAFLFQFLNFCHEFEQVDFHENEYIFA